MGIDLAIIWGIIFIIFLIVEGVTFALVSIWFALAALVALILDVIGFSFLYQIISFIVVSLLSLVIFLRNKEKWFNSKTQRTNLDNVVGKVGIVKKEITKHQSGEVYVEGKNWTAIADEPIDEGQEVIIEEIKGVKLVVKLKNN